MLERGTNAAWNRQNRKGRFLLVVDSDSDHRYFISMLLQRFGYKTFTANTVKEALAMTAVTVPSLIFISTGLKDMNSIEFLQLLNHNPSTAYVPLIFMRKADDVIGEAQCFEQGAVDCLSKPVSVEQLYSVVQKTLELTPRAYLRIKTMLPVQAGEMPHECLDNAYTTDLSEGGMFVRTQKPASVNTRLSCQIHMFEQAIQIDAVVLYRNRASGGIYPESGMGLQFNRIAPKNQELIRRFIRNEITRGIPSAHA